MNEQTFIRLMNFIKSIAIENQDYATGYQRGLRRHYHGENFGTDDEHEKFMALEGNRGEIGRGYRDGFNGLEPDPGNTRNPRNAGRKKLKTRRVRAELPLDPPVNAALIEWAATHSTSKTAAANQLLAEALLIKTSDEVFKQEN